LARQRGRIAGIACEYFDRNRAAFGRAQQTEHDLQPAGSARTLSCIRVRRALVDQAGDQARAEASGGEKRSRRD
jgi:hypothetical protein